MGRLSTFITCLSICYLASRSLSFSIDLEKEKGKIRARVVHITDSAKREDELLKIAVEDREDERARAEKYKEEVGELRSQKDNLANAVQVLQFRSAFEDKVDELYGGSKPRQKSYMDALEDAVLGTEKSFTSNPKMMAFREQIEKLDREPNALRTFVEAAKEVYPKLGNDKFVEAARILYPEFSTAAHNVKKVAGIIPPKYNDFKKITSILEIAGIIAKPSYLAVVSLSLSTVDLPAMRSGTERLCLLISPYRPADYKTFHPENRDTVFSEQDVLKAFYVSKGKPSRAEWILVPNRNNEKKHYIQVTFDSEDTIRNAMHNYAECLYDGSSEEGFKIKVTQSSCYEKTDPEVVFTKMEDKTPKLSNGIGGKVHLPQIPSEGKVERVCLLITPTEACDREQFKPEGEHGISWTDVLNMFSDDPAIKIPKPSKADWVLYYSNAKEKINLYCVQAVFDKEDNARLASAGIMFRHNQEYYLKNIKVKLVQWRCYDESIDSKPVVIKTMTETSNAGG